MPEESEFLDQLPSTLRELAELLGLEKTLLLVSLYGGRELYVPLQFPPEHQVCIRLGYEAAEKIARRYGGSFLLIQYGAAYLRAIRDARLKEDRQTMTINELAAKYGMHSRSVWRILQGLSDRNKPEFQQRNLFET